MIACRPQSNEDLFERFRATGDQSAFGLLVDRITPEMVRKARALGVSASELDDVLQEAFMAMLVAASRFDASRDLSPWLGTILMHKAISYRRGRMRWRRLVEQVPLSSPRDPLACIEQHETRCAVLESLGRLSRAQREVLTPYLMHGRTPESIARELDRPASTVRTQIARAKERLRCLLPAGLTPAALLIFMAPQRISAAVARTRDTRTAARWPSPRLMIAAAAIALVVVSALAPRLRPRPLPAMPVGGPPPVPGRRDAVAADAAAPPPRRAAIMPPDGSVGASGTLVRLVRTLDGAPVPNAAFTSRPWTRSVALTAYDRFDAARALITAADGTAAVEVPWRGATRFAYGRGTGSRVYSIRAGVVDIEIDRVATLRGCVRDRSGRGVAGASIRIADHGHLAFAEDVLGAITDRDGRFELSLAEVRKAALWAHLPGCGRTRVTYWPADEAPAALDLELDRECGAVHGRVWGIRRTGQAAALVSLYPLEHPRCPAVHARSGPDGTFALSDVLPGRYLAAALDRYGEYGVAEVEVGAGATIDVDLQLKPGSRIHGVVVDRSGRTVDQLLIASIPSGPRGDPGRRVGGRPFLDAATTSLSRFGVPFGDGSLVLRAVPAGPTRIAIIDLETRTLRATRDIDVVEGQHPLLDFVFDRSQPSGDHIDRVEDVVSWYAPALAPDGELTNQAGDAHGGLGAVVGRLRSHRYVGQRGTIVLLRPATLSLDAEPVECSAGSDGRFAFSDVRAGRYVAGLIVAGNGRRVILETPVTVERGRSAAVLLVDRSDGR